MVYLLFAYMLFLEKHAFQKCSDLGRLAVEQNTDTVDPCAQNADTDGRADQDRYGYHNLVPGHRAHGYACEHSHRRGKGDVRGYQHGSIVNRTVRHREHHHHKGNDEEHIFRIS